MSRAIVLYHTSYNATARQILRSGWLVVNLSK